MVLTGGISLNVDALQEFKMMANTYDAQ